MLGRLFRYLKKKQEDKILRILDLSRTIEIMESMEKILGKEAMKEQREQLETRVNTLQSVKGNLNGNQ